MKPIFTEDAGLQETWEVFIVRGEVDRFYLLQTNALKQKGAVDRWNRWLGSVKPIRDEQ